MMRTTALAALLAGAVVGPGVIALTASAAPPWHPVAAAKHTRAQTREQRFVKSNERLYLVILTGKMIHKPGWPQYSPADFVVPAHRLITVVIRNLDDGTAPLLKGDLKYDRVLGALGGVELINHKLVSGIANQDVSHTFTIPQLGLNAPIPASSTVEFTFRTPGPGTYTWVCMAPCGTGPNGMGGAMATNGYMTGTMVVR